MLLALEVDHGHRQRVRQLATRRGERGRDQDDRPTPGEWGGKGAGADVQRVDKINTARHHPPKREREREEGSHMGGKGRGRRHAARRQNRHGMPPPPTEGRREGGRGQQRPDPHAQPTAPNGGGCRRSTAPAWADAAWTLSSSAADRQPQGRRSERHQGQGRLRRHRRGHRRHEAAWHGDAEARRRGAWDGA